MKALAWAESRATSARLTMRSFGLPGERSTLVEARAPAVACRLTSRVQGAAEVVPSVRPATSPAPSTAVVGATDEAPAGGAQDSATTAVIAASSPRLVWMPDTCTDATLATARFSRERV